MFGVLQNRSPFTLSSKLEIFLSFIHLTQFYVDDASFEWQEQLQAAQAELEQVRIEQQKSEKEYKSLEYNSQLQVKHLDDSRSFAIFS